MKHHKHVGCCISTDLLHVAMGSLLERAKMSESSTATIVTADYWQDVHEKSLHGRIQHSTTASNLPRSPVLPSNPRGGSFHVSSPSVGRSRIDRH